MQLFSIIERLLTSLVPRLIPGFERLQYEKFGCMVSLPIATYEIEI